MLRVAVLSLLFLSSLGLAEPKKAPTKPKPKELESYAKEITTPGTSEHKTQEILRVIMLAEAFPDVSSEKRVELEGLKKRLHNAEPSTLENLEKQANLIAESLAVKNREKWEKERDQKAKSKEFQEGVRKNVLKIYAERINKEVEANGEKLSTETKRVQMENAEKILIKQQQSKDALQTLKDNQPVAPIAVSAPLNAMVSDRLRLLRKRDTLELLEREKQSTPEIEETLAQLDRLRYRAAVQAGLDKDASGVIKAINNADASVRNEGKLDVQALKTQVALAEQSDLALVIAFADGPALEAALKKRKEGLPTRRAQIEIAILTAEKARRAKLAHEPNSKTEAIDAFTNSTEIQAMAKRLMELQDKLLDPTLDPAERTKAYKEQQLEIAKLEKEIAKQPFAQEIYRRMGYMLFDEKLRAAFREVYKDIKSFDEAMAKFCKDCEETLAQLRMLGSQCPIAKQGARGEGLKQQNEKEAVTHGSSPERRPRTTTEPSV